MEKRTKNILIASGIILGTAGGTIALISYHNRKEYDTLLDFAKNKLQYGNDPKKQTTITVSNNYTDLKQKYGGDGKNIKLAPGQTIGSVVVSFKKAITGGGTDTDLFFNTLSKIKNLYTFQLVNETYKGMYGQSLVDAIKGEVKLYSFAWGSNGWSKYNPVVAYMFGNGANYNPRFSSYINALPEV